MLVLGSAPVLGVVGWHVLQNSKAGTAAKALPFVAFPSTPTAMIAIVNDQNLITSLAVLVLHPGTFQGGTLVDVPVNASSAQTGADRQVPVSDSMINGGEEGVVSDVVSLMRVDLQFDGVLDSSAAGALLAPLKKLPVSLPDDVVTKTADGTTQTLFVSGSTELTPAEAVSVLLARDPAQKEAKRLPNVGAIWNGIAAAVGQGIDSAAVPSTAPTDFNDFMKHFFAGPVQVFNDLTTQPITGKANPDKIDVGQLDVASVVLLMAGLAPSAMIAPFPTLNFRIENGITAADIQAAGLKDVTPVDVTRDLVARLLFLQGNVISASPEIYTLSTKQVPDTTAIFSDGGGLGSTSLDVFTQALGKVDFKTPDFQFPLVNVVIVVGRSYLADMAKVQAVDGSPTTPVGGTPVGSGVDSTVVDTSASNVTS